MGEGPGDHAAREKPGLVCSFPTRAHALPGSGRPRPVCTNGRPCSEALPAATAVPVQSPANRFSEARRRSRRPRHPAGGLASLPAATATGPLAQPARLLLSPQSLAAPSHHQGSAALGCHDTGCQGLSRRRASVWTTEGPSPPRRTQTHPTPAGAAVTDPPRLSGTEQGGEREALCAFPPSPGSAPWGRCWGGTSGAHRWEARISGASRRLLSSGPARRLP